MPLSRVLVVITGLAMLSLSGCATTLPPTPVPTDANEATLTFGVHAVGSFGTLYDAYDVFLDIDDAILLQRLLMSKLFRLDDNLRPQPDLAAEPCRIAGDGTLIRCTLREAWFHDGSPVSADDVVFSFDLVAAVQPDAVRLRFQRVTAVDERTVEFVLDSPDAPFLDDALATVPVGSRALHEATLARVAELAAGLPDDWSATLDSMRQRMLEADDDAQCVQLLEEFDTLRASAPMLLPEELVADRLPLSSRYESCDKLDLLTELFGQLATARDTPPAQLAAAYPALGLHVPHVGSGPFAVADHRPLEATTFVAHERYHHGRPAIDRVVARVLADDHAATEALRRGTVDVLRYSWGRPDAERFEVMRDEPGYVIASFPGRTYEALQFNVRPGRIFHERELRQALRMCIDKTALIDAATGDHGIPLEGPLMPIHWAYPQGVTPPQRDVSAARALIESVGWVAGDDGVYQRAGQRLAADLWTWAGHPSRMHFLELVAERTGDCGMELTVRPAEFGDLLAMLYVPPHNPPGRDEPFDAYFGGWAMSAEPQTAIEALFHSERIPQAPIAPGESNFNYVGYSNPEFDARLDSARTTYDQHERARLYRELHQILLEDQPYLFGWTNIERSYFVDDLSSLGEPLNLESLIWDWQLEKLTIGRGGR